MTYPEQVAGNVRAEAQRTGVSKESLAQAIGVKKSAIYDRWNGSQEWRLSELQKIAPILGVRISALTTPHDIEVDGAIAA